MKFIAFKMLPFVAKTQDTSIMYTEEIINHSKLCLEKLKLGLLSPGTKSKEFKCLHKTTLKCRDYKS